MALLAEQLVDEWLGRRGFFTLRGIKEGVSEIDLLGVCARSGVLVGWHVEVQVSFRPVGYLGQLSEEEQMSTGAKSANSAKIRSPDLLKKGIRRWVDKKFDAPNKVGMRNRCWIGLDWQKILVHGRVKDDIELKFIAELGVQLVPFGRVLTELCGHSPGEMFSRAGTDIADIIRYYSEASQAR